MSATSHSDEWAGVHPELMDFYRHYGIAPMHNTPSPRPDNDETIEASIIMAGANKAPRVTPKDIDNAVIAHQFHVFEGTMLTVCVVTLDNGFTITGESACASPANFNKEIGERIALENAKQKIWPLLGFRLKDRLRDAADLAKEEPLGYQSRVRAEQSDLQARLIKLQEFLETDFARNNVPSGELLRLVDQEAAMLALDRILKERIAAF